VSRESWILAAQITEYCEPCKGVITIATGATGGNDE